MIRLMCMLLLVCPSRANAQQTIIGERLRIAALSSLSGDVQHPDYVSQLAKWKVDSLGAADVRYLFADELHVRSFIADLEQALAGGQIIAKSVAMVGAVFTNPAAGGIATLTVRDLPSAANMAAFEAGDTVALRAFTRATGSLTIGDTYGVVTGYSDQADGLQTWTFTRNTGADAGTMGAAVQIAVDAIALDFGVTGNGYHEINAIDGAYGLNSPYAQIVTWATSPISANRTVRTRIGNLRGITSVTGEYGAILGTYAATNGQYIRASNQAFELHGVNLQMWDGAVNVIKLDRTAPSFAIGSPAPAGFGTGIGIWMGNDGGTYKFRVGNPTGGQLTWDGTTLVAAGWTIGATTISANDVVIDSGGEIRMGTGDDIVRFSAGHATYRLWVGNNDPGPAPFSVDKDGALVATNATITGDGAGMTNINGGNIQTGTITAAKLTVSTLSAISANLGTITAGDIDGVTADFGNTVALNSSGITIDTGSGSANQVKWTDGGSIYSSSDSMNLTSQSTINFNGPNSTQIQVSNNTFAAVGSNDGVDLGTSSDPWDSFFTSDARVANLAGSGTRAVCADAEGDLVICP